MSELQDTTTREIPLTRGKVAIVDAEDYDWLMQWKWQASGSSDKPYAARSVVRDGGPKQYIRMHRLIANTPNGMVTDHKNGNTMDNRRSNLRTCTHSENLRNRGGNRNTSSRFCGVYWKKDVRRWVAQIRVNGKHTYLGLFADEEEAARAYDRAAIELHGEYAQLNFPDETKREEFNLFAGVV